MIQADDYGLAAAIQVKIAHSEAKGTAHPQAAKNALEVAEAVYRYGTVFVAVSRAAGCASDKRRNGSSDPGNGSDSAGDFFDINSGISQRGRHDCPFLSDSFMVLRQN
jgi:hypothetical protein